MTDCRNCANRHGSIKLGTCMASGTYPDHTIQFSSHLCNWSPRPSLVKRVWWAVKSVVVDGTYKDGSK